MFKIIYYPFEDGTNAIDLWLDTLPIKMQAKVLRSIQLLKDFGPTKKTNKTPRSEIDLAKSRREDCKRRFPNG